jgi:hypothetical protein
VKNNVSSGDDANTCVELLSPCSRKVSFISSSILGRNVSSKECVPFYKQFNLRVLEI